MSQCEQVNSGLMSHQHTGNMETEDLGLKSHLRKQRSWGSNLQPLGPVVQN